MLRMQCQIVPIKHKSSFRWKWRYVSEDGVVAESQDTYALYYECVCAARASGYQPVLRGRSRVIA